MSNEAINNLDNRSRGSEIAGSAEKLLGRYELVSERLAQMSINPRDLIRSDDPNDIYSSERLDQDEKYVAKCKSDFTETGKKKLPNGLSMREVKQLAEIAEYDLIRGINLGGWIPHGRSIKTSEFDDIRNGVDMVLEIGSKNSSLGHLGMGVDVSFSLNLQKKFQRIKDDIDNFDGDRHRLGVVKYFQSQAAGMRGELSGLPRVVAAYDLGVLEDLAVKSEQLKGHIGQAILISGMKRQLNVFYDYARDVNPACAEQLVKSLQMVNAIDSLVGADERLEDAEYDKNQKSDAAIRAGLKLFV